MSLTDANVATATRLTDGLFTTDAMRTLFCARVQMQAMLDFEAALARAQARVGIVPAAAAAGHRGAMPRGTLRRRSRSRARRPPRGMPRFRW